MQEITDNLQLGQPQRLADIEAAAQSVLGARAIITCTRGQPAYLDSVRSPALRPQLSAD